VNVTSGQAGTITAGPITNTSGTWWQVKLTTGVQGWTVTSNYTLVTVTPPPPPPPPTTTTVPCTATYTNATGALAINCTLPTTLSSSKLRAVAVAHGGAGVAPNRVSRVQHPNRDRLGVVETGHAEQMAHDKALGAARPDPVGTLKAVSASSGHSVALKWTASTDAGVAYSIYRLAGTCPSTSTLTGFSKIAIGLTTTSYSDAVTAGAFCYTATATLNGAESIPSNSASVTVAPAAPTNFGCDATLTGQAVGVNCTPTE
jgi:hypothetical protein